MRGTKRSLLSQIRVMVLWFGLTIIIFHLVISEVIASLDQELQQKRQALANIEAQADKVRSNLSQEFPNDKRIAPEIVNSDIANLQKMIDKLKDARLAALTVQVVPQYLDPSSAQEMYRQLNKKLNPYFKVDSSGKFEWGPAFQNSYLNYIPLPSLDALKTFLEGLIQKHENSLNKRKGQLRILKDEEDLKNDIDYLQKQIAQNKQQQWKIIGLRIICPKNEIYEDEALICRASATIEGQSGPKDVSIDPDTSWTPGVVIGGNIRGVDLGVGQHRIGANFRGHTGGVNIRVVRRPVAGPLVPAGPLPPGPVGPPGPAGPPPPGPAGCIVPDVVGYSEEAARYDIIQAKCHVGTVTYRPSDAPAGEVIVQNPAAGTALPPGGTVRLVVSENEPRRIFVDPPRTTIDLDESVTFTATLIYKDGKQELLPNNVVQWQPGNPFTGTNPGTFTITATARGISGSATLIVNEPSGSTTWERPMTSADQRGLRLPAPPPDAFTWYALCERRTGDIVYGENSDPTKFDILGGPFPGPRTVKAWIDERYPSWRCPSAVPQPHKWHVLCDKKTFDIVLGKDTDPTRYDIISGPFAGEPEARAWTNTNRPSWRCPGGPIGAGEGWYALCDKRSFDVVLGKHTDPTKYDILGGPFHGEPEARSWTNVNWPSWRCPGGPVTDGWYVLCDDKMGVVVLGKNTIGYRVMRGPFHGEPEARAWTDNNCPSWRCGESGACGEVVDLYVLCVKSRGQVIISKNFNPNLHHQMAGPFKGHPAARKWLRDNCSSELCDANGSCFTVSLDKTRERIADREQRRSDDVSRRSQDTSLSGLSRGGSKDQEEILEEMEPPPERPGKPEEPPTKGENNYYIIMESSIFLERTAKCISTEYRVEGPVTEEQVNQLINDRQKEVNKKIGVQAYPLYLSIKIVKVSKHPTKPTAPKGRKVCKNCPPGQHIGLDPDKRFCHAD